MPQCVHCDSLGHSVGVASTMWSRQYEHPRGDLMGSFHSFKASNAQRSLIISRNMRHPLNLPGNYLKSTGWCCLFLISTQLTPAVCPWVHAKTDDKTRHLSICFSSCPLPRHTTAGGRLQLYRPPPVAVQMPLINFTGRRQFWRSG